MRRAVLLGMILGCGASACFCDSTYTIVNVENRGSSGVVVYTDDRDTWFWFTPGGCSYLQPGEAVRLNHRGHLDALYVEGNSPGASIAVLIKDGTTDDVIVTVGEPIEVEEDKSRGNVSPDRLVNVVNESNDSVHVGTDSGLFTFDELTVAPHSNGTIEIFDDVVNRLDVSALSGIRVYFPDGLERDLEVRVPGQLPIVALPTMVTIDDPAAATAFGPGLEAAYGQCEGTPVP